MMAEPMEEHTVMEEVRKNFLNFVVSKAPHLGMASAMSTRHSTGPAFCCKLDKGLHLWSTAEEAQELWKLGWLQWKGKPQMTSEHTRLGREQGHSLLGDSPADPSQELWHWPSLPRTLAALPSPRESVCLYLQNACFSISAIYNFHVHKTFIIKIFIMACNALHSTMYLGYIYIYTYISNTFHLPAASWMEATIANEKARGTLYRRKHRELGIVLVLLQLNYGNWHLFVSAVIFQLSSVFILIVK